MQSLFQDLPGVVYEFIIRKDESRSFLYISENCEQILGVNADMLLHDSSIFRQILLPEDVPFFEETLDQSHATQSTWNWEGRILVHGEIRWIETRSNAVSHSEGVLRKGIMIDITDRKSREQEQEVRLKSLVEHLPLGIGIHVNGEIVMANKYAHELLRVRQGELIGRKVMDFVHPDSRQVVLERMQKVLAGETLSEAEEKFVCDNGELIFVETSAMPFTFKGQSAIQLIVRDVTKQKRVEEEIRKNETLFTQLFNNVPIAVVMLDANGRIKMVNPGFSSIFGYDLPEVKGNNLNDFIVPSELQDEGIDLNNLIASKRVIQIETFRKRKDGQRVDVILYGMPIMIDDQAIGIYGVYVDITSQKQLEEELKTRNIELDNFVYKVSHDLRAPLSSILGLVNLSKLPGNTDDLRDYIRIIGEKVADLDHFISDVLSHSKNLKLEVKIDKVDFKNILSRTVTDLNYLDGAADVQFDVSIDPVEFYSDPWRIGEIFRNLVSNAIKYRQDDDGHPRVQVNISASDDGVQIEFTDNGIGISENDLNRIFEMFYRATEQSDGSGIGLYIVKNAVEKLDGVINVQSKPGEGTTFTIQLPDQRTSILLDEDQKP
ncbi:MAG: PAS domain-containing sensor histidine kinase [Cyclobacteriaceae bacterium]|nr:PAS domain-containing sensor histidine kinase [Cyclobacteriaceae bacterium]